MESGLWKREHEKENLDMKDRWSPSPLEDIPVGQKRHPMILNISSHLKEKDPNRKPDPNPNETRTWGTPQERMNELIQFAAELKKKMKIQAPTGFVYDSAGPAFDYNNQDRRMYIEEALKGADMNPTWRQNIFSQRPEDDDEELRQQIDNNLKLKHYRPNRAYMFWDHERYCILERRQYERDISATEGFEVGYYPYLGISCCGLITRYYCPPDAANLSADSLARLYALATYAIRFYNSEHQSCYYSVANVIKAMTAVAAGTWFYLTFQASNGDHLCTFEAKLFESIPCLQKNIQVSFVRRKMEAGSSSFMIQEPQA